MALHLVGETIDKTRSHYLAASGKLVSLMRSVLIDAGDDPDAMVQKHAVRIARHLYPRAYLSAASSILLGPTRDGRLFISGRRNSRTRLRTLEIVQNVVPKHPSLVGAIVDDGTGELRIDVSSMRQRFLEAFRLRSEHAASIDEAMRAAIAARLIEEFGDPKAAADAVWTLARENEWFREAEGAERYLLRAPSIAATRNEAVLERIVAWHGTPIGTLVHDGVEWRWNPAAVAGGYDARVVRQTIPGKLPPFIVSLLPEGWLEAVLKERGDRAKLRSGRRYMSNIAIVQNERELAELPAEILETPLARYTSAGAFTGLYAGPGRGEIEATFEENLARIFARPDTPRLSGIQIKAPMYLEPSGTLSPATGKPFTHILKPAGTGAFEALPIVEWTVLTLARGAGFDVPSAALIAMPAGMPPALLVERFDIRTSVKDERRIALDDFCSILGLPTEAKYDGSIERVARAVRQHSTAVEEDLRIVVLRALFAWLIADGDMHLKNLAMLEVAEPGEERFRSVRMAPVYDAVTTRVFPGLHADRMALKVNGKDDRLDRADFRALAATAGLKAADANAAIDRLLERLAEAARQIVLPDVAAAASSGKTIIPRVLELTRTRIDSFG